MEYIEEYNTKDAIVTLLQDFLSTITEEYEASENIIQTLSSPISEDYIEKIKSGLEFCCPLEIKERFLQTIESALLGELTDFFELDSLITELYRDIDRLSYTNKDHIEEGIYKSDNEDFTIGVIWTSKITNGTDYLSASMHTKLYNRHTANDEEDDIEKEYINYYIEEATRNRTIAWYDGSIIQLFCAELVSDLYNLNPITDDKIEKSNIKVNTMYFAPFEFEEYKTFIKKTKCSDVKSIELGIMTMFFFFSSTTWQDEILSSYGTITFWGDDTIGRQRCRPEFLGKLKGTTETIYKSILSNRVYFNISGEVNEEDLESITRKKTFIYSAMNFYQLYKYLLEKCPENEFQKIFLEDASCYYKESIYCYKFLELTSLILKKKKLLHLRERLLNVYEQLFGNY